MQIFNKNKAIKEIEDFKYDLNKNSDVTILSVINKAIEIINNNIIEKETVFSDLIQSWKEGDYKYLENKKIEKFSHYALHIENIADKINEIIDKINE